MYKYIANAIKKTPKCISKRSKKICGNQKMQFGLTISVGCFSMLMWMHGEEHCTAAECLLFLDIHVRQEVRMTSNDVLDI